jgi:hypothetical protein
MRLARRRLEKIFLGDPIAFIWVTAQDVTPIALSGDLRPYEAYALDFREIVGHMRSRKIGPTRPRAARQNGATPQSSPQPCSGVAYATPK